MHQPVRLSTTRLLAGTTAHNVTKVFFGTSHTPPASLAFQKGFFTPQSGPAHTYQRPASTAVARKPIFVEHGTDKIIAHREVKNWSDKCALAAVRLLRWGLDFATGYKHEKEVQASRSGQPIKAFVMNEKKYMIRNVFLESVAVRSYLLSRTMSRALSNKMVSREFRVW